MNAATLDEAREEDYWSGFDAACEAYRDGAPTGDPVGVSEDFDLGWWNGVGWSMAFETGLVAAWRGVLIIDFIVAYVQIGRMFVGSGFSPDYNAAPGLQDAWSDLSAVEFSDSGAMFANARRRRRSVSFVLRALSHDESAIIHEMQRRLGTFGEVLYLPDPADYATSQRYGFIGRLRELSPIEYPWPRIRSAPFAIEELL